jgi:TolB-like protein/DNA-binding winged helix-turn-helix (wHTH) protein/tetratricopeptide (TPR) repeat protein
VSEAPRTQRVVRFASFDVDVRAGEVRKHGIRIRLQNQPFRVLQVLLEHAGEVVPREELQRRIWPSDTFVDFDRGLNNAVLRLREALDDSADTPRYVETVAKRGYRFIATITPVNDTESVNTNSVRELSGWPVQVSVNRRRGYRGGLLAVSAIVITLFAFVFFGDSLRNHVFGSSSGASIHSIAVLPLQNLSASPDQEYFSDGMTEELITELSRVSGLRVISRTSVMKYKKSNKSLPEIARELNVDAILEGSVLRSADRVRITAQLIQARNDSNVWAETYDRDLQDTLAVQEAVATAVAEKIGAVMTPGRTIRQSKAGAVKLKAHEAYLLGLHETELAPEADHGMQATVDEHLRRAQEYYQQALREDPNYAPVYVGLAGVAGNLNDVEANLRKAVELDDNLSHAHLLLGALLLFRDLNWQDAERELLRAIEVNSNNADAHQGYAYFLDATGRLDEGMKEYQRAQELDPANDHLAAALYARREYGRLIELEHRALATNPPGSDNGANAVAHKVLMVAYARTGKRKESVEEFRSALVGKGFYRLAEEVRRGYLRGGYEGAWRAYLRGRKGTDFSFAFVDIYAHIELGDFDQALAHLPTLNNDEPGNWDWQANSDGASAIPSLATLRIEPMWDPLHSDPRFEALAGHVGLPTSSSSSNKN